ncbi:MAG: hypothetical protein JXD19_06380 [Deltaproteobacteria bacterium]|nr:hypothetical protein [Deltaproteobacteria bacterium]
MPIAQYLCDKCGKVLEQIASEEHPANMTYAPPNTRSHFFQCGDPKCNSKFLAFESPDGKWQWEIKEEEAFKSILKGVNERQERIILKEEKEKLTQEKLQLQKMVAENPKKIAVIKNELDNIKTQVNKLTDEYEERNNQSRNLEEAVKKGNQRLEEIDKRLKELIHIK